MTARPERHEGGCLCGALRYRIEGPLAPSIHCHCRLCQRSTGAPVVTWVSFPATRFTMTRGTPAEYASSSHGRRLFCADCGTQIAFRTTRRGDDIDVTVASLDHPEDHAPGSHIWTESRLTWLRLDEHLPGKPQD